MTLAEMFSGGNAVKVPELLDHFAVKEMNRAIVRDEPGRSSIHGNGIRPVDNDALSVKERYLERHKRPATQKVFQRFIELSWIH
jgi:hypothetical protein